MIHYANFEPNSGVRKMSYTSFFRYMKAYHPAFRLPRRQDLPADLFSNVDDTLLEEYEKNDTLHLVCHPWLSPDAGFVWENNSCAADTLFMVLLALYNNFEDGAKKIFHKEFPIAGNILRRLLASDMSAEEFSRAKCAWIRYFYCPGSPFKVGGFVAITKLIEFMMCTAGGCGPGKSRVFSRWWYYNAQCSDENCSESDVVIVLENEGEMYYQTRPDVDIICLVSTSSNKTHGTVEETLSYHASNTSTRFSCGTCDSPFNLTPVVVRHPLILLYDVTEFPHEKVVPSRITFGGLTYKLMAVIYHGADHFNCCFYLKQDNTLYFYDGQPRGRVQRSKNRKVQWIRNKRKASLIFYVNDVER